MKEFIKNNKEILITLFCVWIGIAFTLTSVKLSSIDKKLSELDSINFSLRNLNELGGLRDLKSLEDIYGVMIDNYRRDKLKDLGL
jgi:hypothetical protein